MCLYLVERLYTDQGWIVDKENFFTKNFTSVTFHSNYFIMGQTCTVVTSKSETILGYANSNVMGTINVPLCKAANELYSTGPNCGHTRIGYCQSDAYYNQNSPSTWTTLQESGNCNEEKDGWTPSQCQQTTVELNAATSFGSICDILKPEKKDVLCNNYKYCEDIDVDGSIVCYTVASGKSNPLFYLSFGGAVSLETCAMFYPVLMILLCIIGCLICWKRRRTDRYKYKPVSKIEMEVADCDQAQVDVNKQLIYDEDL